MPKHLNAGDCYGISFTEKPMLGRLPEDALNISQEDRNRLRFLAEKKHRFANEKIIEERRILWKAANDLTMIRPPVFIDEIPWIEMNQGDLDLRCSHDFARELEENLLKEVYCYEHGLGDMVVEDFIECPLLVYDSGFGIDEVVDTRSTEKNSDIVSRHFHILIADMADIEKIKEPDIYVDHARTQQYADCMREIFDGILPVKITGPRGLWFTPWDFLIRVMGIGETMLNLYDNPEFIEAAVERYVDCAMLRLHKYTALGIWASNNAPCRVGSGGYGLTNDLPQTEGNELNCNPSQLWGCGNAQIFSDVSSKMHWQFSLQYEMRWLSNFGLNYYGCCEPLYNKMDILEKIPNLRKVSMSPWNRLDVAASRCKGKYVMSCKPSPALFASDHFDAEKAVKEIDDILQATKGCDLEIVMKDISTVNYHPEHLWEWAKIAKETIEKHYS